MRELPSLRNALHGFDLFEVIIIRCPSNEVDLEFTHFLSDEVRFTPTNKG